MQTKLISFLASLLLYPSFLMAERTSMTVVLPEIKGAALVTGNNVNLRKQPSPNSPQLVHQMDKELEGSDAEPENAWSDTPLPRGYWRGPHQLYEGNVMLVVNQADGWSQIIVDNMLPWAKDTFLSFDTLQRMGIGIPPSDYSPRLQMRLTGVYEDFCAAYYLHELQGSYIYLGVYNPPLLRSHLVGFPLQVECFPTFNPNIRGISIRERPGELPEINFGPDAAIENMFGNFEIDLSKLTDEQFNLLLNIASPVSEELIIFAFDDKTYYILFSPDEYQGTLIKKEIPIKSLSSPSSVQNPNVGDGTVYDSVDTPPSFPGGLGELMSWLGRNIHYPTAAAENGIMGRVLVKFIVSTDGSIRNAEVVKGVAPDLDKEALRVVNSMPKWTPGVKNGHPVNSWYTIPITFKLN